MKYHPRVGLCSWSLHTDTPTALIEGLAELKLQTVQIALQPFVDAPDVWKDAKQQFDDAGIILASGMFGTKGEDYSTLDTIRRTGGVVPDEHWDYNWQNIQKLTPIAESLGLDTVSCHAGFLPSDQSDPTFGKLIERLGKIADLFVKHNLTLMFETGQETADTLWQFLEVLDKPNVTINFDPANMILYDKGDPIESLRKLLPKVRQVHIKDATRTQMPGTWGLEVPAGQGEVDWDTFVQTLEDGGFTGSYIIEREVGDSRHADVTTAAAMVSDQLAALAK